MYNYKPDFYIEIFNFIEYKPKIAKINQTVENLLEIYTKDHIEKTVNCSVHLSLTKINFTALSINTRTAIL